MPVESVFRLEPSAIWLAPFQVLHCDTCGWRDPNAYHFDFDFADRRRWHAQRCPGPVPVCDTCGQRVREACSHAAAFDVLRGLVV